MLTTGIPDKFTPVDIAQVRLTGLLGRHVAAVPQRLINGQGEAYIGVFEPPGDNGRWRGEDAGKWIEAACNTWKYTRDEELRRTMDEFAARLIKVQEPDGTVKAELLEIQDPACVGAFGFRLAGVTVGMETGNPVGRTVPMLLVPFAYAGLYGKHRVEFAAKE